jgi:hypothetical protein
VQLVPTLVDREHPAEAEEHEGDDERPEVDFLAVAERVLEGRRALGALEAQEEQQLVAAIGRGVHRLRQHRARAGEESRDELGHGDGEVAAEGEIDGLEGIGFVRHGAY